MSDKKNKLEKKSELYVDQYKRHFDQQKKDNDGLGEFYNYFFSGLPEESTDFLNSLLDKGIKMGASLAFLMDESTRDPEIASALRSSVEKLKLNKNYESSSLRSQDGDVTNEH